MKDFLEEQLRTLSDPGASRHLVREYLQVRILSVLQNAGAMIPLAFHGGTCLRIVFGLPRWSEDLDFALEGDAAGYDLRGWLLKTRTTLAPEGYEVELKIDDKRVVHQAFVTFRGLLRELGLSGHRAEALSVKVEVDTRAPAGAVLETSVVRRFSTLRIQHHDRASLLAGKLHAILCRPYVKGRDLYDLVWYLGDRTWPEPNLTLLENALTQSGWQGARPREVTWRAVLRDRLVALAWDRVVADVAPFVPGDFDLKTLGRDEVLRLVDGR